MRCNHICSFFCFVFWNFYDYAVFYLFKKYRICQQMYIIFRYVFNTLLSFSIFYLESRKLFIVIYYEGKKCSWWELIHSRRRKQWVICVFYWTLLGVLFGFPWLYLESLGRVKQWISCLFFFILTLLLWSLRKSSYSYFFFYQL